jgi:hypothetical protein
VRYVMDLAARYGPPSGGLNRVRWFFLCFAVFFCVTAPLQTIHQPRTSRVPVGRAAGDRLSAVAPAAGIP